LAIGIQDRGYEVANDYEPWVANGLWLVHKQRAAWIVGPRDREL
jgi:hypothetical protein